MSRHSLTRRDVLLTGAALAALPFVASSCSGPSATPRHPNVLYVFSDSHRACSTGCYGSQDVLTPGFDAFGAQGLRLTTALSNTPQCRPYRASLMSGAYACETGLVSNNSPHNVGLDADNFWQPVQRPTLGAVFRDAGYRCGYVGKWHLGPVGHSEALHLGFEDLWRVSLTPAHDYASWTYIDGEGQRSTGQGFRPRYEVDQGLAFIDAAPDERPWLLVLSWGPPHEPLEPPPGFLRSGPVQLPPNIDSAPARRQAREELPRYRALIEAIDVEFARLLAELDARGLAEDTLVVYTSDHGNQMGSHDLFGKEMPYDESLRVPFLARWPGRIAAGSSCALPFGAPDVLPTLAGLAGLPPVGGVSGLDLSGAFLDARSAASRDAAYIAAYDTNVVPWPGWRGVRTAQHVYVCTREGPWLLFDCLADPYQQQNLVQREPALRDALHERTRQLMDELGDRWG